MPGDSCVHLFISVTYENYASFDFSPSLEVRVVSLGISKAYNSVLHEGLAYKIKRMGLNSDLLNFTEFFLFDRQQSVPLNGQESEWMPINAVVPQVSIQESLLLLLSFFLFLFLFLLLLLLLLLSSLLLLF